MSLVLPAVVSVFSVLSVVPVVSAQSLPSIRDYDPSERVAAWVQPGALGHFQVLVATFPSPVATPFPANDTVWVHLALPEGTGPFPCVLVLPILGEPEPFVERLFFEPLLRRGVAAALVELPQQFHRRPKGANSGAAFLGRSPETLRRGIAQAVLDVRRSATWLASRPEIDGSRLAVLGISLGALTGSAAYSVDGRFKDAVFLLGGADFRDLLAKSELTGKILPRLGIPEERLALLAEDIEPLLYKDANAARPALLINAAWDRVVPPANGLRLAEAFPAARQIWVPGGHYSAIVHVPWISRLAARRLAGSLGGRR